MMNFLRALFLSKTVPRPFRLSGETKTYQICKVGTISAKELFLLANCLHPLVTFVVQRQTHLLLQLVPSRHFV